MRRDGVFAVLFLPDLAPADFREEKYCGLLCRDKRMVFVFMILIFPATLLVFYLFYKL